MYNIQVLIDKEKKEEYEKEILEIFKNANILSAKENITTDISSEYLDVLEYVGLKDKIEKILGTDINDETFNVIVSFLTSNGIKIEKIPYNNLISNEKVKTTKAYRLALENKIRDYLKDCCVPSDNVESDLELYLTCPYFAESVENNYDVADFDTWKHLLQLFDTDIPFQLAMDISSALWEEDIEVLELPYKKGEIW